MNWDRNDPESFVDSFDKLVPSYWQTMVTEAGEHQKQQVPSDPSTLLTLRAVYEVIDGLVAKGKLQRGKYSEMDENGWPKLCDGSPVPSQSRTALIESPSPRQKLGLFSLSSFDTRVPPYLINSSVPSQQRSPQPPASERGCTKDKP